MNGVPGDQNLLPTAHKRFVCCSLSNMHFLNVFLGTTKYRFNNLENAESAKYNETSPNITVGFMIVTKPLSFTKPKKASLRYFT
jgi:hypothetical protein